MAIKVLSCGQLKMTSLLGGRHNTLNMWCCMILGNVAFDVTN